MLPGGWVPLRWSPDASKTKSKCCFQYRFSWNLIRFYLFLSLISRKKMCFDCIFPPLDRALAFSVYPFHPSSLGSAENILMTNSSIPWLNTFPSYAYITSTCVALVLLPLLNRQVFIGGAKVGCVGPYMLSCAHGIE